MHVLQHIATTAESTKEAFNNVKNQKYQIMYT